jgi:ParB-like chromosome segregation protein Spo0J
MKRYSGDLLAILGKKQKEAALRNNAYEVQMIDAHDIIPNSKNFYGIREVEELATRMKISGHITPLEVVARDDEPGKYTLISGERRRAAMLYRLEQGEIEKAVMPCIVRVDLDDTEALTAEEVETINIICANDYRDKTPFEKLDEVQKLKPIARKCWEKEKNRPENFRMYFAKSFLGISPSSLQRITVLEKLVPEARSAYEDS